MIEPGTEFIVAGNVALNIGGNGEPTTLIAAGTAAAPIVFRGEHDTPGYWNGIEFRRSATPECKLEHVEIRDAGKAGSAALRLATSVAVTHTTIANGAGAGIEKEQDDGRDYVSSNMFVGMPGGAVIDD